MDRLGVSQGVIYFVRWRSRSGNDNFFISLRHQRWIRLCFHPSLSVWLCTGYLKKLWTDPDEILWTGLVCDTDELIRFWLRSVSGSNYLEYFKWFFTIERSDKKLSIARYLKKLWTDSDETWWHVGCVTRKNLFNFGEDPNLELDPIIFFNDSSPLRERAKLMYSTISRNAIGPDMFSWIRHCMVEVCALPIFSIEWWGKKRYIARYFKTSNDQRRRSGNVTRAIADGPETTRGPNTTDRGSQSFEKGPPRVGSHFTDETYLLVSGD